MSSYSSTILMLSSKIWKYVVFLEAQALWNETGFRPSSVRPISKVPRAFHIQFLSSVMLKTLEL